MNVAEMLLRLGCTMVAWMVIYTHLLWLATLRVVGCNSDGDEMWRLLLGFAPLALGFSLALQLTRRLHSVHTMLRWAGAPLILLVPLALMAVWPTFMQSSLGSEPICSDILAGWHPWWAPVQLATVTVLCVMAYRAWKPGTEVS